MNCKKAQMGIVNLLISLGIFLLVWFIWLGKFLNDCGQNAIDSGGLTGIEAFFYGNLNLVLALVIILALFVWATFGGSSQ